jgi:hypothetical protein
LTDGTLLRAVEVVPVHLPNKPSETEQRIIERFIEMHHATDHCFVCLRNRVPPAFRDFVPEHIRSLDCQALTRLEPPLLKAFAAYLEDHDEKLGPMSLQTLANALATFGVRPITRMASAIPRAWLSAAKLAVHPGNEIGASETNWANSVLRSEFL